MELSLERAAKSCSLHRLSGKLAEQSCPLFNSPPRTPKNHLLQHRLVWFIGQALFRISLQEHFVQKRHCILLPHITSAIGVLTSQRNGMLISGIGSPPNLSPSPCLPDPSDSCFSFVSPAPLSVLPWKKGEDSKILSSLSSILSLSFPLSHFPTFPLFLQCRLVSHPVSKTCVSLGSSGCRTWCRLSPHIVL